MPTGLKMAGLGSCQTRRRLRGLGISFFRALLNGSFFALATSGAFTDILTGAAWQHHYFRANSLGDRIKFGLADMELEEFKIATFHSNNRKAWKTFTLSYTGTFTHKYLCHEKFLSPADYGHMLKTIICYLRQACQLFDF
jgi:hypothetical protein